MTQRQLIDTESLAWLRDALSPLLIESTLGEEALSLRFAAIETDSRVLEAGVVFAALSGERFDGHDYVEKAREAGAVAAIVSRRLPVDIPQLVVADVREAFGLAAKRWRARYSLGLAAVGGSNGKTTTTQMIASILRARWGANRMLATAGNLNNEIGVPKTLFGLRFAHRAAVVEAGMNHPGEMARLADWIRPSVAVLTNAQREHQEFLSSVAETAHENGLLIAALAESGVAVYPTDDPSWGVWASLALARGVRSVRYAAGAPVAGAEADLTGETREDGALRIRGVVLGRTVDFTLRLAIAGEHNRHNAVAAAAAALALGVDEASIVAGLEAFEALAGRGRRLFSKKRPVILIDDAYNANPDSVLASMAMLAAEPTAADRRVFILGDMGEIGADALERHAEMGERAKALGIGRFWTVGALSEAAAHAYGEGAKHFPTREALLAALDELLAALPGEGDEGPAARVVVKASHAAGLEKAVEALAERLDCRGAGAAD
ncbi:UDP-N-acetylmuramoyl-tripeptide--D-alanyl-D-alanine ligase [Sutterella massiliensis]|uniref:UDP-N-acetylmuramoyl-tripeptide--D-alanyl-D-alanine ligase n=1 Tax=Sutterella massiliensis TaxID=1816689 RepID=A0ABS2DPT1_9BURK|nr:UDP-N-acetylmuramoyl-tripeptide--D-alanyl-D-alanine ligase [Sutterella massiliensis]MBM6703333.1 UDP-N-acetylmuramoyl-tripeptide--D-alanyl-D-alanine ligase [Sutterella massiliensis]